jgi:hypothetical protein
MIQLSGAERLRRQHRLVGCLLGSFPQHKQQNLFHTLPLLLMPEEVLRFAALPLANALHGSPPPLGNNTTTTNTDNADNGPQR